MDFLEALFLDSFLKREDCLGVCLVSDQYLPQSLGCVSHDHPDLASSEVGAPGAGAGNIFWKECHIQ